MPAATTFQRPLRLPLALRVARRLEFPHKLGLFDRWFGRRLAAQGIGWVRTAAGPVWKLDLANQTHRWIVYGYYEGPALWRWLKRHSTEIRTIVDSGANIGQTVLYFSTLTPAAHIIAFEPGSAAREWLTDAVAANHLRQVVIESAGLGAAASAARLAPAGAADRHGAWSKVSATEGEPIAITALDDELDRRRIATVDLWKLDLEGYEPQALEGATRSIAAGRIRAVYVEIAGDNGSRSTQFLVARGYTPHRVAPSGRLTPWRDGHPYECALFLAPGAANALG